MATEKKESLVGAKIALRQKRLRFDCSKFEKTQRHALFTSMDLMSAGCS